MTPRRSRALNIHWQTALLTIVASMAPMAVACAAVANDLDVVEVDKSHFSVIRHSDGQDQVQITGKAIVTGEGDIIDREGAYKAIKDRKGHVSPPRMVQVNAGELAFLRPDGSIASTFKSNDPITGLRASPNGKYVAFLEGPAVRVDETTPPHSIRVFSGEGKELLTVPYMEGDETAISTNGTLFIVNGPSSLVRCFALHSPTSEKLGEFYLSDWRGVYFWDPGTAIGVPSYSGITISQDGQLAMIIRATETAPPEEEVSVVNMTGNVLWRERGRGPYTGRVSPAGDVWVVISRANGSANVRVFSVKTRTVLWSKAIPDRKYRASFSERNLMLESLGANDLNYDLITGGELHAP